MPSVPVQSPAGTTVGSGSAEAGCAQTIIAAIAGDSAAVNALLTRIRPLVVRYCRARVTARAGHGDADDIARDICLAVLSGLSTFVGAPHQVLPWVYGIATQKVTDYYRHSGRDPSDGPLTSIQREVLILRVVVGLSTADTAAATGLSTTSVRVIQHRALNRLRHQLATRSLPE